MSSVTTLINETDVQNSVVQTPFSKNHKPLLKALQQHFPEYEFHLMGLGGAFHLIDGRLLDDDHNEVAPSWRNWLEQQLVACHGDLRATVDIAQAHQYLTTRYHGQTLFIAVKTGDLAADFIQLDIEVILYEEIRSTFCQNSFPFYIDDLRSLQDWASHDDYSFEPFPIPNSAKYTRARMTNTAKFLQTAIKCHTEALEHDVKTMSLNVVQGEHMTRQTRVDDGSGEYSILDLYPDYLDQEIAIKRLFDDWNNSSAGQSGAVFFKHWYLKFNDNKEWKRDDQARSLSAIPGWCTSKKLAEIKITRNDTPYSVMDKLTKFDNKIGHPFAWYFFMLHGSRISSDVGHFIADAILAGELNLSVADDQAILLKWNDRPYGF